MKVTLDILSIILIINFVSVKKPRDLTHVDVVSILSPAVRAYTILFYQARLDSASILLLFSALSVRYYNNIVI